MHRCPNLILKCIPSIYTITLCRGGKKNDTKFSLLLRIHYLLRFVFHSFQWKYSFASSLFVFQGIWLQPLESVLPVELATPVKLQRVFSSCKQWFNDILSASAKKCPSWWLIFIFVFHEIWLACSRFFVLLAEVIVPARFQTIRSKSFCFKVKYLSSIFQHIKRLSFSQLDSEETVVSWCLGSS